MMSVFIRRLSRFRRVTGARLLVGVLFGLCAAWTATPVAGVPADWPGWEEVPGEAAGWVSQLPEGIDVKEETLANFLKHLTGVLLRDAVLEHWVPEGAVEQAKEALGFSEDAAALRFSPRVLGDAGSDRPTLGAPVCTPSLVPR